MSNVSEITLGDDGGAGPAASALNEHGASAGSSLPFSDPSAASASARSAALAQQLGISDQEPPWWARQLSRASSLVFNGGVVALVRAWVNPPTLEVTAEGGAVPDWYAAEWAERTRWRRLGNQVARDTAAVAGVMLLMDGVEAGMRGLRGGRDDPWNRVMGGVSGGGLLGLLWYPGKPRGRAYMTAAGSFVGYFSYTAERAVDASLLRTQRQLEQELLQKPEYQLRTELNRPYLQSLLRAKQRQLNDAKRRAVAELVREEQRGLMTRPPAGAVGGGFPGTGSSAGASDDSDGTYGGGDDGGGETALALSMQQPVGGVSSTAGDGSLLHGNRDVTRGHGRSRNSQLTSGDYDRRNDLPPNDDQAALVTTEGRG